MDFDHRFLTAQANEACRAYQQLTGDFSLVGATTDVCRIVGGAYYNGSDISRFSNVEREEMVQNHSFTGVARKKVEFNNYIEYSYHNTVVAKVYKDGRVVLNSGGWRTETTKRAINQALNENGAPFAVYQKEGKWLVLNRRTGETLTFQDNIKLK